MPASEKPQATYGTTHGYESKDIKIKWPVIIAFTMIIAAVLIHVLIWYWLRFYAGQLFLGEGKPAGKTIYPARREWETFPQPRIQSAPVADMTAWAAREEAELANYGWVDQKAGIVRIPIDRAMEIILQQGLPSRTNGVSTPPKNGKTPLQLLHERRDRAAEKPGGNDEPEKRN